jgi:putative membrane protein
MGVTSLPPRAILALYAGVLLAFVISAISPHDYPTWAMETAPVMIALPALWASRRSFALTTLLYVLIALHALVLIGGGAYTYAEVPAGFRVKDALGLARNPYDKLGHFMQGLVPAMLAREILLRKGYVTHRGMVTFLSLCVAEAISAWYELIEWWAALALGQGAEAFLGTQGDVWDTQSDMFFAGLGAIAGLLLLRRLHDGQLALMRSR